MQNKHVVVRDIDSLSPQFTSHGIGEKLVLLANNETQTNVTQIAITRLSNGDKVETHVHQTMDEHYIFLEGEGLISVGQEVIKCKPGRFVLVPAGLRHNLQAVINMRFITIGVATT